MVSENLRKYRFKFRSSNQNSMSNINLNKKFTFKFIVDKAVANEYKAKPVRWLIIAISGLAAFIMGLIILTMSEKLKNDQNKIQ